jgi:hypothetical protein
MEITLFIDQVGFTVVGEVVEKTDKTLKVKNPAVLQAAPNQQNQLQVQLLPILFREFLDEAQRADGVEFTYNTDKIVVSNANLDSRLRSQYEGMFSAPAAGNSSNDVVKLFDE